MFQPVDTKVSFPQLEQSILELWKERQIVEKNLASGDKPFVFYEGPPTASRRPGLHHAISRIFKDIICRYRSMQGYKIIGRREGWDTHGLPVEIEVEKILGFRGKPDIERYGSPSSTRAVARASGNISRTGRSSPSGSPTGSAKTPISPTRTAIESLWWIFRQLWDNSLSVPRLQGHHAPPGAAAPRSRTTRSRWASRTMSTTHRGGIRFRVAEEPTAEGSQHPLAQELAGAAFLAWTTTPWTLPANVALGDRFQCDYALVALTARGAKGERLIMAAAPSLRCRRGATALKTPSGNELVGLRTPAVRWHPRPWRHRRLE